MNKNDFPPNRDSPPCLSHRADWSRAERRKNEKGILRRPKIDKSSQAVVLLETRARASADFFIFILEINSPIKDSVNQTVVRFVEQTEMCL